MKLSLRISVFATLALGSALTIAACADDAEPETPGESPSNDAASPLGDAAAPIDALADSTTNDAADATADAERALRCSDAGWCETRVDDATTVIGYDDLWPLESTAFAVDSRGGLLEYDGAVWRLVNDTLFLQAIWASGPDDVWAGGTFGKVVHGARKAGVWTWTTEQAGDNNSTDYVVSIWGSGPSDVYVVRGNTLYHRGSAPDAGADAGTAWIPEYPVAQADFSSRFVTGTGPDDVWFLGYYQTFTCGKIVHKANGVYQVVADCAEDCSTGTCYAKAIGTTPIVDWDFSRYAFMPAPRTIITVNGESIISNYPPSVQKITLPTAGPAQILRAAAPGMVGQVVWGTSQSDLYTSSTAVVTHNPNAFVDGGVFSISTTALDGLPLITGLKVRGTGASNIWVFGGTYALQKR